ncbi:MAG: hypothetical protein SFV22_09610 [Saprospiraceae bacterium]|nr:hypothetical protein [Saprospiraceae bacterium]
MKKTTLIACLILLFFATLSAQWRTIENWGALPVNDLEVRGNLLYAGAFRDFFRSTNGGLNWEKITSVGPYEDVFEVETTENGVIYIGSVGADFLLRRSRDGGLTWESLPSPDGGFMANFLNGGLVCAGEYLFVTNGSKLYRIAESGTNWEEMTSVTAVGGLWSLIEQNGVIWVGTQSYIGFRSDDAGQSWQQTSVAAPFLAAKGDTLLSFEPPSALTQAVNRSLNGGQSWERIDLTVIPRSIKESGGVFWMITTQRQVLHSSDGVNWQPLDFLIDPAYWSGVTAYQGTLLFPFEGGMLRSTDGGDHWWGTNKGMGDNAGPLHVVRNALFAGKSHFTENAGENWKTMFEPGFFEHLYRFDDRIYLLNNEAVWRNTSSDLTRWEKVIPAGSFGVPFSQGLFRAGSYLISTSNLFNDWGKVYRSADEGFSWEIVANIDGNLKLLGTIGDSTVIGLNYPQNGSKLLLISRDLGVTWQPWAVEPVVGYENQSFQSIGQKVYTINGLDLLCSEDYGQTWVSLTEGKILPDQQTTHSLRDFTVTDSLLFVVSRHWQGYDNGLWMSFDTGHTWVNLLADLGDGDPFAGNVVLNATHLFFQNGADGKIWVRALSQLMNDLQTGTVYWDFNNDGQQNSNEPGVKYGGIRTASGNVAAITNENGHFILDLTAPDDTVRPVISIPYSSSFPAFLLPEPGRPPMQFAVRRTPGIRDLRVEAVAESDFLGGRNTKVHFFLNNDGTEFEFGAFEVIFNEHLSVVETTPDSTSLQNNRIVWYIDFLPPLQQRHFVATFNAAISNTVLDVTLIARYSIFNDTTPLNNADTIATFILNSYDPNDKQVDRTQLTPLQAAQLPELTYTIRFQNTGTYPAFDVRLLDTLSPLLDPATIKILGASHPFQLRLSENRILEFVFNDIYLPDSTRDELNSHGFVHFSIRPRRALQLGESVPNTAHIFFDFNPAIVTNTALTTVVAPLGVLLSATQEAMRIYPNPSSGEAVVCLPKDRYGAKVLELYSIDGRWVGQFPTDGQSARLSLESQKPGCYLLRWQMSDGRWCYGKLILN